MEQLVKLFLCLFCGLLFTPVAEAEWVEQRPKERTEQQATERHSASKHSFSKRSSKQKRQKEAKAGNLDVLGLVGALFGLTAVGLFVLGFAIFGANLLFAIAIVFAVVGLVLSIMSVSAKGLLFWNTVGFAAFVLALLFLGLLSWIAAVI